MANTNMAEEQNTQAQEVFESLNGTQKCAILMLLIGEEEAANIMTNLNPDEVKSLGTAMYQVQDIDQDTVNLVLDEFLSIIKANTALGFGATSYISTVMSKALGQEKAQSVLSKITPQDAQKPIDILQWMDAKSIAELINDEHPQIIAVILSYLESAVASDVLSQLDPKIQPDIIYRLSTLENIQPEALKELESVMERKFNSNASLRATQAGGIRAAANVMNYLKSNVEASVMKELTKKDKDVAKEIQENMFDFENLAGIDDKSMQFLIRSLDNELIVVALKGADDSLSEKFFGSMSQRAAANIKDEMEALGPMRLTDVQEAQKQVIAVARQLADEGQIVLSGRGGDEYL